MRGEGWVRGGEGKAIGKGLRSIFLPIDVSRVESHNCRRKQRGEERKRAWNAKRERGEFQIKLRRRHLRDWARNGGAAAKALCHNNKERDTEGAATRKQRGF